MPDRNGHAPSVQPLPEKRPGRPYTRSILLVRLLTLFAIVTVVAETASQAAVDSPRRYYLALGDSLAFHDALGFEREGVAPNYDGAGASRVLLAKRLA